MVESILHAIVFRARRTGVARGTLMERIHYTHLHIFSDTERKHKKQMFIQQSLHMENFGLRLWHLVNNCKIYKMQKS